MNAITGEKQTEREAVGQRHLRVMRKSEPRGGISRKRVVVECEAPEKLVIAIVVGAINFRPRHIRHGIFILHVRDGCCTVSVHRNNGGFSIGALQKLIV
jgi:hypothetical protein